MTQLELLEALNQDLRKLNINYEAHASIEFIIKKYYSIIKKTKMKKSSKSKSGLYSNIHAKRKRIKSGSGEKMRSPGSKGAPTAKAFKKSAKTRRKY
jgi:hypothetical protein